MRAGVAFSLAPSVLPTPPSSLRTRGTNRCTHLRPVVASASPPLPARPSEKVDDSAVIRASVDVDVDSLKAEPESGVTWSEPPCLTPGTRALRAAMQDMVRGVESPSDAFAEVLEDSCVWKTPVTDGDGRGKVVEMMEEFVGFVLEPVILFTAEDVVDEGTVRLEWLLSFTYPLPWRPRVTLSGHSVVSLSASQERVVMVVDSWDAPVLSVIRQALPRISDIVWLYPSPHAEIDVGTRKLLRKGFGYQIVRVASRPEILIEGVCDEKAAGLVTAVPALPFGSFFGGLRRKEDYATVSPISVRSLGKDDDGKARFEYAVPVPGPLFDENSGYKTPLPPHTSPDARIVMSPARRCAVMRYRGYAEETLFEKKLATLVRKLQADGHLRKGQEVDRLKVWARSYDSKIGFNGASQMAIGTCGGGGVLPPRWNELLIELPDNGELELS